MSGAKCAETVQNSLRDVGSVNIDIPTGRVIVNSSLPWVEIQEKIEQTGRKAVLSGFGGTLTLCSVLFELLYTQKKLFTNRFYSSMCRAISRGYC